jgi:hypothetical protein
MSCIENFSISLVIRRFYIVYNERKGEKYDTTKKKQMIEEKIIMEALIKSSRLCIDKDIATKKL